MNIEIMRAFVELRRAAGSFAEFEKRLEQIELDIGARLSEHEEQLSQIFEALRRLIAPPPRTKRPIGFRVREDDNRAVAGQLRDAARSVATKWKMIDLPSGATPGRSGSKSTRNWPSNGSISSPAVASRMWRFW